MAELSELGQDRGLERLLPRARPAPRDLDVERAARAERGREVGAPSAGTVRLERQLEASVGEQERGHAELGANVEPRFGRHGAAQLLADLVPVRLGERPKSWRRREPARQLGKSLVGGGRPEEVGHETRDGRRRGSLDRSRRHAARLRRWRVQDRTRRLAAPLRERRQPGKSQRVGFGSSAGSNCSIPVMPGRPNTRDGTIRKIV